MNKQEVIKLLKNDIQKFNKYKEKNKDACLNLREADLRFSDLSDTNLRGADLRGAKLDKQGEKK